MSNNFSEKEASYAIWKIWLIIAIGFIGVYFYKMVLVNQMGFCSSQMQFMKDNELILNNISGLMKAGRIKLDALDISPQAYFSHHPTCCDVVWGNEAGFSRGFLQYGSATVTVIYEMSDSEVKRSGSGSSKYYEFIENVTACGEPVDYIGTATSTPNIFKPVITK